MVFCNADEVGGPFVAAGTGTIAALVFERAARTQNSLAELVLSFASHATVIGNLQPMAGVFPRYRHGDVVETHFQFIVQGNPDIAEGDRTMVSAFLVEIAHVERWGIEEADVRLRWVGR